MPYPYKQFPESLKERLFENSKDLLVMLEAWKQAQSEGRPLYLQSVKSTPSEGAKVNISAVYADFLDAYQKSQPKTLKTLQENLAFTNITPEEHVIHVVAILFAQDSTCRPEVLKEIAAYAVREDVGDLFHAEMDRHTQMRQKLGERFVNERHLFTEWAASEEGQAAIAPLIRAHLEKVTESVKTEMQDALNRRLAKDIDRHLETYVYDNLKDMAGSRLIEIGKDMDRLEQRVQEGFTQISDLALIAPDKIQKQEEEMPYHVRVALMGAVAIVVVAGILILIASKG